MKITPSPLRIDSAIGRRTPLEERIEGIKSDLKKEFAAALESIGKHNSIYLEEVRAEIDELKQEIFKLEMLSVVKYKARTMTPKPLVEAKESYSRARIFPNHYIPESVTDEECEIDGVRMPNTETFAVIASIACHSRLKYIEQAVSRQPFYIIRQIARKDGNWLGHIYPSALEYILRVVYSQLNSARIVDNFLQDNNYDVIVFWNNWHDNYLGACLCSDCESKPKANRIGRIAMRLKKDLESYHCVPSPNRLALKQLWNGIEDENRSQ